MTKMTQGSWTRIRPLQIDDVDAKTAAAIKTGELTRGGLSDNLVKVMAYCPRFAQLEVEYANSFMFDPVTSSVTFRPPASTTGSSRNWSSCVHRC
jgi:hypothetical protein